MDGDNIARSPSVSIAFSLAFRSWNGRAGISAALCVAFLSAADALILDARQSVWAHGRCERCMVYRIPQKGDESY